MEVLYLLLDLFKNYYKQNRIIIIINNNILVDLTNLRSKSIYILQSYILIHSYMLSKINIYFSNIYNNLGKKTLKKVNT